MVAAEVQYLIRRVEIIVQVLASLELFLTSACNVTASFLKQYASLHNVLVDGII